MGAPWASSKPLGPSWICLGLGAPIGASWRPLEPSWARWGGRLGTRAPLNLGHLWGCFGRRGSCYLRQGGGNSNARSKGKEIDPTEDETGERMGPHEWELLFVFLFCIRTGRVQTGQLRAAAIMFIIFLHFLFSGNEFVSKASSVAPCSQMQYPIFKNLCEPGSFRLGPHS